MEAPGEGSPSLTGAFRVEGSPPAAVNKCCTGGNKGHWVTRREADGVRKHSPCISSDMGATQRHTKHAKCPSPGAREAGQEAHRGPEKDLAPGALSCGPEKGHLSEASPEPLPPAWEIRVEVIVFSIFADKHKC